MSDTTLRVRWPEGSQATAPVRVDMATATASDPTSAMKLCHALRDRVSTVARLAERDGDFEVLNELAGAVNSFLARVEVA